MFDVNTFQVHSPVLILFFNNIFLWNLIITTVDFELVKCNKAFLYFT